jgi:hypothetical protein
VNPRERKRPNYSHGRWQHNPTVTGFVWVVRTHEESESVIEKYFYSINLAQAVLQAELKQGRCAVMTREIQPLDDIPF